MAVFTIPMQSLAPPTQPYPGRRHSVDPSAHSALKRSQYQPFPRGRRDSTHSAETIQVITPADHNNAWSSLPRSNTSKQVRWQNDIWAAERGPENVKGQEALKQRKKSGMPNFNLLHKRSLLGRDDQGQIETPQINEQDITPQADEDEDKFQIEWFNSEIDYEQKKSEKDDGDSPHRQNSTNWQNDNRSKSPTDLTGEEQALESVAEEEDAAPVILTKRRPSIFQRLNLKTSLAQRRRNRAKSDPFSDSSTEKKVNAVSGSGNDKPMRIDIPQSPASPKSSSSTQSPQSPQSPLSKTMCIFSSFWGRSERPEPAPELPRRSSFTTNFGFAKA